MTVYVVAAEYSAHPRSPELASVAPGRMTDLGEHRAYPDAGPDWERDMTRLFWRYPRNAEGWAAWGREAPVDLTDLLGSACHRALSAFHDRMSERLGDSWAQTRARIDDLMITSMPGMNPSGSGLVETISPALIPQTLRAQLGLAFDCRCQFVVGTSDSGAWAFANAVRAARAERRTILVAAGQIIPSGYAAQKRIRQVLGRADQEQGLDMLAIGDFLMDTLRRTAPEITRETVRAVLADVRERKQTAAQHYPATMWWGNDPASGPLITPYYHARDIAPACCGAAAVIVTSDPEVARALSGPPQRTDARHRSAVPVEVLGVGEGTSNPSVTYRKSPLSFGAPAVQALSSAAVDADVPMRFFTSAAFSVLHDAFPSIELTFLLSMGLDWNAAVERMRSYWPNPFGGLLTFGHALGASGLVQICKVHHILSADRRYAPDQDTPTALRFSDGGALAFTTSVGGPLSHIVVSLFRGGVTDPAAAIEPPRGPDVPLDHQQRRRERRQVATTYRDTLDRAFTAAGVPTGRMVEGLTQVDLRSALLAVDHAQVVAGIDLAGLVTGTPEGLEAARTELAAALTAHAEAVRGGHADLGADYDAALRRVLASWRAAAHTEAGDERQQVRDLKSRLRVPLAVLSEPRGSGIARRVVPVDRVGDSRFARLEQPPSLAVLDDALASHAPAPPWLQPPAPQPTITPDVAVVAFELRSRCAAADHHHASEVLARAAARSRGWLARFPTTLAQSGDQLRVVVFDADAAVMRHAMDHYARDLVGYTTRQGIPTVGAIVSGVGQRFVDADGNPNVASAAQAEAAARTAGAPDDESGLTALWFDTPDPAPLDAWVKRPDGWWQPCD